MQGIRHWLAELGLEQYAAAFEANDVDRSVLSTLTEADLQQLGVSLGHRKRILLALRALPRTDIGGSISPESLTAAGERRQVTVLFCDLVGSTALSTQLDPEDYRAVLSRYHEICIGCVQRFEGYTAQIQGDGVLAYFGYPLAHEGEAERAVRAALAVVHQLVDLDAGVNVRLQVRIGVASGLVVVSHVLAPDKSAVGETPNLAQRLQTLAQANEVLVSARVRDLAGGVFEYEDRGLHALKGIAEPARAWRVTGLHSATSRFDAYTRGRVSPIVGREQEIALVLECWERARDGAGQVLLLEGEPGIGKSRLLGAIGQRLGSRIETLLQYQCSPFHANSAFHPFAEQLERALRFQRDDDSGRKLHRIEQDLIGSRSRNLTECQLLARVLSIPCADFYPPLEMSPQRQREETVALLADLITDEASRHATALFFEDAHWADPSTLQVLDMLVERAEHFPLLMLLTCRPGFEPAWRSRAHATHVELARLSRTQGAGIVIRVAQDKPLPADLIGRIVDRTDGVPLFLEELTKTVLESGLLVEVDGRYDYSGTSGELAIPATLRDSLTARLDRLATVKEIAQIGAAIGREFSHELACAVSRLDENAFALALDRLIASELVHRRGLPPTATYIFKHALVRDAAYDSLLKSQRQALHGRIAEVIRERFSVTAQKEPELLAHHYTEAGLPEEALPHWKKAGDLAQGRVALQEAISHFERGLTLALRLPESQTRDAWELQLRALLGMAWVELNGYAHPRVAEILEPAMSLGTALDDGDHTLRLLWGLWVYLLCTGQVAKSLSWAQRLLEAAEQRGSESMHLAAHWAACNSHHFHGDFTECVHHANAILARYDAARDRHMADLINHDPKTIALAYRAASEWRLGYPDRAAASAEAALENSRLRGHVFDICWAHTFLAHTLYTDSGATNVIGALLDRAEAVAAEQKLHFFTQVYCPLSRTLWLLRCGQPDLALARFQADVASWQGGGMEVFIPHVLAMQSECLLLCGQADAALPLLEQALERIGRPEWEERDALANVLRIQGQVMLAIGDADHAEALFKKALLVAREQQARSWELKVALSYARLLQQQDRHAEGMALLQPIHDWFEEGRGTGDLADAARLLQELDVRPRAVSGR